MIYIELQIRKQKIKVSMSKGRKTMKAKTCSKNKKKDKGLKVLCLEKNKIFFNIFCIAGQKAENQSEQAKG